MSIKKNKTKSCGKRIRNHFTNKVRTHKGGASTAEDININKIKKGFESVHTTVDEYAVFLNKNQQESIRDDTTSNDFFEKIKKMVSYIFTDYYNKVTITQIDIVDEIIETQLKSIFGKLAGFNEEQGNVIDLCNTLWREAKEKQKEEQKPSLNRSGSMFSELSSGSQSRRESFSNDDGSSQSRRESFSNDDGASIDVLSNLQSMSVKDEAGPKSALVRRTSLNKVHPLFETKELFDTINDLNVPIGEFDTSVQNFVTSMGNLSEENVNNIAKIIIAILKRMKVTMSSTPAEFELTTEKQTKIGELLNTYKTTTKTNDSLNILLSTTLHILGKE
jgi:hypothetical protein